MTDQIITLTEGSYFLVSDEAGLDLDYIYEWNRFLDEEGDHVRPIRSYEEHFRVKFFGYPTQVSELLYHAKEEYVRRLEELRINFNCELCKGEIPQETEKYVQEVEEILRR